VERLLGTGEVPGHPHLLKHVDGLEKVRSILLCLPLGLQAIYTLMSV
jgi:hypothetical protein